MGELLALFLEFVLQALFELIVHVVGNGTKRTWWRIRGKSDKRQDSLEARRLYHEKRMQTLEELRRLRYERKYGNSGRR